MKTAIAALAAGSLLSLAGVADARQATATTTTTTVQQTTTATSPAPRFTLDTPIEQIAADPAGRAVLEKDLPGLLTHEAYDRFKSMSLHAVQPMSNGRLTDAGMSRVQADLAGVK